MLEAVTAALAAVTVAAAEPTTNLMPPILEAVRVRATVGEVVAALEAVYGRHHESASL